MLGNTAPVTIVSDPSLDGVWPRDPTGPCRNCNARPATVWWIGTGDALSAVHGMVAPWCKLCCFRAQLTHAEERAKAIPDLIAAIAAEEHMDTDNPILMCTEKECALDAWQTARGSDLDPSEKTRFDVWWDKIAVPGTFEGSRRALMEAAWNIGSGLPPTDWTTTTAAFSVWWQSILNSQPVIS